MMYFKTINMDLDFSSIGMSKLITDAPETISSLLLYQTTKVKKALFEAYKNNPNDKGELHKGFINICKRYLSSTEKIEFLERWNRLLPSGLFDIINGKIDKNWIDNLNYWLYRITDNAKESLEIAYQTNNTQYIPEFGNHIQVKKKEVSGIFVPKFSEEIINDLYSILSSYFDPKERFMNFLSGKRIDENINFMGTQNELAGIFILSKEYNYLTLGTHQETFDFIKQTFLIKGKPIVTKQILSYLKEPGSVDKFGNLKDETKPGKANRKTFIDISI